MTLDVLLPGQRIIASNDQDRIDGKEIRTTFFGVDTACGASTRGNEFAYRTGCLCAGSLFHFLRHEYRQQRYGTSGAGRPAHEWRRVTFPGGRDLGIHEGWHLCGFGSLGR